MELGLDVVYILIGFILLLKGGDYLVEGAVSIARKFRLSPMVIGLTVVGFGTSAPEWLVSVQAAIKGSSGIAIGNVVGSNIANIGMILGATAMICALPSKKTTLFRDMPFMLFAVVLLTLVGLTGTITRVEGIIGILMLCAFVWWQVVNSRKHPEDVDEDSLAAFKQHNVWVALLIVIISCAALAYGADILIKGSSGIAMIVGKAVGVSQSEMERIVGLTIVAVGTSLPELFASVIAARKGQADMAIGNIIGSVTFNILSVIGCAAAICPIHNANVGFTVDYMVMTCISILLWGFMKTRKLLDHWEGVILLLAYIAYLVFTCIFSL